MSVEILEIKDHEILEKLAGKETEVPNGKRGKLRKCKECGMNTYQKEGVCVLCKTGIREAAKSLME